MFDRLIRFAARFDPHAVAAIGAAGHVTYTELDEAIDRVAAELYQTPGLDNASPVGIALRDQYLHLIVVLACARIGLPSASLLGGLERPTAALAGATRLIADQAALDPAVLADQAWTQRVLTSDARPPAVEIDPDAIGRIHFSSGTTGTPKACALSWQLMTDRIRHSWTGATGLQRMLSLVAPESGALQAFLSTWASNGCLLFGDADPRLLARQVAAWRPTGILATPTQIAALLDAWPIGAPPLASPWLFLAGSRLDRVLRERVARQLGARVSIAYGSTEAGVAAIGVASSTSAPGATGTVTTWTEIAIVDDEGAPVPPGATGRIRLRGSDVVTGYLGEAPFADGWFETGDLGSLDADDQLVVLGRADDVMNLGGRKIAPEDLEEAVRRVPGVADVAAFALADGNGIDEAWLAVVRAGDIAEGAIGAVLPPDIGTVRISWIEAIPRTALGKPQRERLRESARALSV